MIFWADEVDLWRTLTKGYGYLTSLIQKASAFFAKKYFVSIYHLN